MEELVTLIAALLLGLLFGPGIGIAFFVVVVVAAGVYHNSVDNR